MPAGCCSFTLPGRRSLRSLWRCIQHSPGFRVLAVALERHVSAEASGIMRGPFSLAGEEELRTVIAGAGFREITIRSKTGTVRFPSAARLVQDYAGGSPLAGHVAKISDEARAALVKEVGEALQSYVVGGALAFPIEAHLASAKK